MNTVEPIRRRKDIDKLKRVLEGRNRLLLIVGVNSALRISDILKLRVCDVLDEYGRPRNSITVKETKTRKAKTFRLNDAIKRALRKHVDGSDREAYLFQSRKGENKPISRTQAYRILQKAADTLELDVKIGTHSLRKSFAFHAYQAGVPLETLQTILNHSSPRETLRYIGIVQDDIDNVYLEINL